MKRTGLKNRKLPDYTRGEEIFNMVSHIVGGAFGIVALVLCLITSILKGNPWSIVSSVVYGVSMVLLYTMSSVYHGLLPEMAKKVMQVLDHCTIYLLIAGTYTPIALCAIRPGYPAWGWALFGGVWAIAIVAIVFTAIDLKKYAVLSMICYIGMGWCVVLAADPVLKTIPVPGLIVCLGLSLIGPFLGAGLIGDITSFSGAAFVLSWGLTSYSLAFLRKKEPNLERPYKVPGGAAMGWFAGIVSTVVFILLFIPASPMYMKSTACIMFVGWMIIGLILYLAASGQRRGKSQTELKEGVFHGMEERKQA